MWSSSSSRRHCKNLLALALIAGPSAAFAETEPRADNPEALLNEAFNAYRAGNYSIACPKYEEVVRVAPGLGARLGLGDCYRDWGQLVKAWGMYEGVADDAPGLASVAESPEKMMKIVQRGQQARERMRALEPQLSFLTVAVPEALRAQPGFQVFMDDVPISPAQWGRRRPVEKGAHLVSATAVGREPWQRNVAVGSDGAAEVLEVGPMADIALKVKSARDGESLRIPA